MRSLSFLLGCSFLAVNTVSPAQGGLQPEINAPARQTSAQQRLTTLTKQMRETPQRPALYAEIAMADLQLARETVRLSYIDDAQASVNAGLALQPKDFGLAKAQVAVLLAKHRWMEAREQAKALNQRVPDDGMVYGYLAEAEMGLGNYDEATQAAQWMLNMRPNNIPGLLLAGRLRVLFGDVDGALDLYRVAYSETSPTEFEDQALLANEMAQAELSRGRPDAAAALLERSLANAPGYGASLENMGRARLAQQRAGEAVTWFRKAAAINADPHVIYLLANAERAAGDQSRADADLKTFVAQVSMSGTVSKGISNEQATLDLILLEADQPTQAKAALTLAEAQIAKRHDVLTEDAYAWALYRNAQAKAADVAVRKALAVGIQSAPILEHAGRIAEALGNTEQARKDFDLALRSDPSSTYSANTLGVHAAPITAARSATLPAAPFAQAPQPTSLAAPQIALAAPAFAPIPAALLTPRPGDTEQRITSAQTVVRAKTNDANALATLGAAYLQRARETGNVDDYSLAETALTSSLAINATDFSAAPVLETQAEVYMGEHRFAEALQSAQQALGLGSGDLSPFAIVGDAYADMGDYVRARQAYARLTPPEMTLSPRAAYARDSRLAYLNFVEGDTPGAIALMKTSVAEGTAARLPRENLAWLYYELGEFLYQAGDIPAADQAYVTSLTVSPGGYRALAALGKLRANRGSYEEAALLYQRAIAIVPMPLFVAELGDLYVKMGKPAEAKKQYDLVVYIGLLGKINQNLHNRDLALFYSNHNLKPAEALLLAQREFEVRHDIYTWDALAWALYKNGKPDEARKASDQALAMHTQDALLLFHAGMIADAQGQQAQARKDFQQALNLNPQFHLLYADEAKQKLAGTGAVASAGAGHASR